MLITLQAALLALVVSVNSAHQEVRIGTQAMKSKALLSAIETSRKHEVEVKVVIGAKADFSLDDSGQPTGGNRPYDNGPQGWELSKLAQAGAQIFIPPKFSELYLPEFQPGVMANMAIATIDHKIVYICSGSFSEGTNGLCWVDENKELVAAVEAVHESDFNDLLKPEIRLNMIKQASNKALLVTPDNKADFYMLLQRPWTTIYTSLLSDGPVIDSLLNRGRRAEIFLTPRAAHSRKAIQRLQNAGWTVSYTIYPFQGTVMQSDEAVFIGTQRLDQLQITKSRDIGIVLPVSAIQQSQTLISSFGAKKP